LSYRGMVPSSGVEPPASSLSATRPNRLGHDGMSGEAGIRTRAGGLPRSALAMQCLRPLGHFSMAVTTGLEPAASGLTGRRSDLLSYATTVCSVESDPHAFLGLRVLRPAVYQFHHERVDCRGVEPLTPGLQGETVHQHPARGADSNRQPPTYEVGARTARAALAEPAAGLVPAAFRIQCGRTTRCASPAWCPQRESNPHTTRHSTWRLFLWATRARRA
jgi:hypothetical protein